MSQRPRNAVAGWWQYRVAFGVLPVAFALFGAIYLWHGRPWTLVVFVVGVWFAARAQLAVVRVVGNAVTLRGLLLTLTFPKDQVEGFAVDRHQVRIVLKNGKRHIVPGFPVVTGHPRFAVTAAERDRRLELVATDLNQRLRPGPTDSRAP